MDFWDNKFYSNIKDNNDSNTIYKGCKPELSYIHYLSVEKIILKFLYINNIKLNSILDIGSGTGHWIVFYYKLNQDSKITGIEISKKVYNISKDKYKNIPNIKYLNNNFLEMTFKNEQFNIINAIGVMFHFIEDDDFIKVIKKFKKLLSPNGIIIIGGEFGDENKFLHFINDGKPIKKLRSLDYWKNILEENGFKIIQKKVNNIRNYFKTPQNNLLFIKHF